MNFSLEDLGAVFADALLEIISKVSGVSLDVISSEPDGDFDGIISMMNLTGKNDKSGGTIFISANEPDMRVLCSLMTGVPKEGVTKEDIGDALSEFVNMTAGSSKLRLGNSEHMFTLSTPFVINGENMSLATKKRVPVISKHLGNGEVSLKLKVVWVSQA